MLFTDLYQDDPSPNQDREASRTQDRAANRTLDHAAYLTQDRKVAPDRDLQAPKMLLVSSKSTT